jgi:hypothetical protein
MALSDSELAAQRGITVKQVQEIRRLRGTSNEAIERAPDSAIRKAMRKLAFPDAARKRYEFDELIRRDNQRRVERGAHARAVRQCAAMRGQTRSRTKVVAGVPTDGPVNPLALVGNPKPPAGAAGAPAGAAVPGLAGLARDRWQWLGPGNIGGRTRAIVIHPTQPQRMLAASAGGGVWFTENGGARWDPVDDFMANLAVCCLAIDPSRRTVVYAGTGEGFGNGDALRGGGIFKLVGTRWQSLAATQGFSAVNRIGVSHNGKTVLAATSEGLMRSIDTARATWTNVIDAEMADVKCHPGLSTRAVAAARNGGRAWYSTDGGATWKPATADAAWQGRVELAYARVNPNIVYASVDSDGGGELWRSNDGGKTYKRRTALDPDGRAAPFLGGQGWYSNVVWAGDPSNADLVLVGGVNLWRSTDGGQTMAEISTWWDGQSAHADHHAIVAHPQYDGVNNRTVFFGNDGGIYKATDITALGSEPAPPFVAGWQELNNNYGVSQFYGGAVNVATGCVVAGAQDNGSLALRPGADSEHWNSWFGGDGGWCASNPSNSQVFYGEYVYLNIHRNGDGVATDDPDRYISGQFWNSAAREWQWKPAPFQIADARTESALFIAPFVIDARRPDRLLGGGLALWETTDARAVTTPTSGPRWRTIKAASTSQISAVAIAPSNSDIVWIGYLDGTVFRSTNSTAANPAWQACGAAGANPLAPRRMCTRVALHPTNPAVAYATFGGYVADNVWITRDVGMNWAPLGRSLPAAPVRTLAVHPRHDQFLYVGTEVGVFASEDGGVHWSPTNEGPANVSVDELFWGGEVLYAATHGRGMYRIDLSGV